MKLAPLWRDFIKQFKYKYKEMNLKELIVRLRIEEDNRKMEKIQCSIWANKGKFSEIRFKDQQEEKTLH